MNNPEVLIVHHTASGGNKKQFDAVNRYHKDKWNRMVLVDDWWTPIYSANGIQNRPVRYMNEEEAKTLGTLSSLGYYAGYTHFIEKDGTIIQARSQTDIGAHTIGWNDRSFAVCLAGNFEYEHPTTKQIKAYQELKKEIGLPVDLHRNKQANRSCPGRNIDFSVLDRQLDTEDMTKEEKLAFYATKFPSLKAFIYRIMGWPLA